MRMGRPTIPSPTTCRCPEGSGLVCPRAYRARGCLASTSAESWRLGLRLSLAGSPQRPAESSLPYGYGLAVFLPLLSTPPRGDAVTFGYEVQTGTSVGTFTPQTHSTCRRTSGH